MNTAWTAASEELYKATQDAGGPQAGADGGANGHQQGAGATGENVTDAEFEEVK
jgi:molecular chaperone DnaK